METEASAPAAGASFLGRARILWRYHSEVFCFQVGSCVPIGSREVAFHDRFFFGGERHRDLALIWIFPTFIPSFSLCIDILVAEFTSNYYELMSQEVCLLKWQDLVEFFFF